MKKVLFCMPSYSIGGITLSLYALLSGIDPNSIQASILAKPVGYYYGKMPNCQELQENFWVSYPLVNGGKLKKSLQMLVYGFRFILAKIGIDITPLLYKFGSRTLKMSQYDVLVNFSEGTAYLNSMFQAKKKYTWIHCEYRRHLAMNNYQKELIAYSNYDKIFTVSEFAKSNFIEVFPQFKEKVKVIHNCIDAEGIKAKAMLNSDLDSRFDNSCFTIISIGRLDPVKQFDKIPGIARQVKDRTKKQFRWYIIGGGSSEWVQKIQDEIIKNDISDNVILLGEQPNVYPYISKANLLVHTSKSESFSLVVKEAKCLNVPSLVNDYECASEFISDGKDGLIFHIDVMAEHIAQFIEEPIILQSIVEKLQQDVDDRNSIINQLYNEM